MDESILTYNSKSRAFLYTHGVWTRKQNCNFSLILLPAKSNDKVLWKLKETPLWTLLVNFRANKNFSGKSASVTFFLFEDFYRCSKFLKETNKLIPTEIGYRHTYVRTSMNSHDLPCLGSKIKAQSMHSITKKPSFPNNILYSTKFSLCPILYRKLMCEFENS